LRRFWNVWTSEEDKDESDKERVDKVRNDESDEAIPPRVVSRADMINTRTSTASSKIPSSSDADSNGREFESRYDDEINVAEWFDSLAFLRFCWSSFARKKVPLRVNDNAHDCESETECGVRIEERLGPFDAFFLDRTFLQVMIGRKRQDDNGEGNLRQPKEDIEDRNRPQVVPRNQRRPAPQHQARHQIVAQSRHLWRVRSSL